MGNHTTMNRDTLEVQIRPATEADLDAINEIYNYYIEHSTCTYALAPTSSADRLAWFQDHSDAFPIVVAEREGQVIGWGSLSPYHARPGYRFTVENSIYVRHNSLARGIGSRLLAHLVEQAQTLGYHAIIAGISADQTPSLRLHERFGFTTVGHLREVGFKFNQWLDVVYMQRLL